MLFDMAPRWIVITTDHPDYPGQAVMWRERLELGKRHRAPTMMVSPSKAVLRRHLPQDVVRLRGVDQRLGEVWTCPEFAEAVRRALT